jgi:hypothetical protein
MLMVAVRRPICKAISACVDRCDTCDGDLTHPDFSGWRLEWPCADSRYPDGFVQIEFSCECCRCGQQRRVELNSRVVGQAIRLGCPVCGRLTTHRRVSANLDCAAVVTADTTPESNSDHAQGRNTAPIST